MRKSRVCYVRQSSELQLPPSYHGFPLVTVSLGRPMSRCHKQTMGEVAGYIPIADGEWTYVVPKFGSVYCRLAVDWDHHRHPASLCMHGRD